MKQIISGIQTLSGIQSLNSQINWKNDFTGNKILLNTYSIKYASQSWTLVILFFQMYNIKKWKQDFLQIFYSFASKENFCENCL